MNFKNKIYSLYYIKPNILFDKYKNRNNNKKRFN